MEEPGVDGERDRLKAEILNVQELFWFLRVGTFDEWLRVDLTIPQLKTLVLVYLSESAGLRMGQLAASLRVALSTATGIVDRLVDHGLLARAEAPEDRRSVIVTLTRRGRETIEQPHLASLRKVEGLLDRLDVEDLRGVARALAALHRAARAAGWTEDTPAPLGARAPISAETGEGSERAE